VTIIGHPTGRNVGRFPGYEFDYDAVFAAAARTGTALEIDGQPGPARSAERPRAPRAPVRRHVRARQRRAYGSGQLANVSYAVGQARRGIGSPADEVLNARPLDGVRAGRRFRAYRAVCDRRAGRARLYAAA
jgi:DNA polymerase (family 10)